MTAVPHAPLPSSTSSAPLPDHSRTAAARLSKWFLALAIATWIQIGFGALVRAKKAGLACPDWPLCYGAVVPDLKLDGVIYEWGHRAFASVISILFVFCFVLGWRQPVLKARIGRWLVGAAGLLLAQIVMGGLTVLIVHKGDGDPRPAAWTVSIHLILGNLLAALAILASQDLRQLGKQTVSVPEPVAGLTRTVLGFWTASLLAQFVLGGAIAGNIAGLVCTEFPTCNGGVWFPTFEGFVGLQVVHRLNAYLLLTLALTLAFRVRSHPRLAAMGKGLAVLVLLQACVGAVNIFAVLHTHVTTLHSVLAALLFSYTAVLWHRMLEVRTVV